MKLTSAVIGFWFLSTAMLAAAQDQKYVISTYAGVPNSRTRSLFRVSRQMRPVTCTSRVPSIALHFQAGPEWCGHPNRGQLRGGLLGRWRARH